jgi:NADH:ubiquinone oxidoreductase subunit 5 (subunit L)/multisubunit Na+/H+ antiporter MnhA subunit
MLTKSILNYNIKTQNNDFLIKIGINFIYFLTILKLVSNIYPNLPFGFMIVILFISIILEILILSNISEFFKSYLKEISLTTFFLSFLFFLEFYWQDNFSSNKILIITNLWVWLDLSPEFIIDFKFLQSSIFIIGIFLVSLAGILILGFSIEYMANFELIKFFLFISFFILSMLICVLSNDWILMFFGWEGIGLMSFLLISFWKYRHEAGKSALKAFFTNKIGDSVILIFITVSLIFLKSSNFGLEIFWYFTNNQTLLFLLALLIILAILGKSAQFIFHFWLDDAMEGPTPVSALIHAATLVTAGSFLVFKSQILFLQPTVLNIILIIGFFSSISGILASLEQDDLKKTIAYTTLTNIGIIFMFIGLGFFSLAFLHLIVHGFYKAFTFLSVGNFIHLTAGEQSAKFKGISSKNLILDYFFILFSSFLMLGIPFLGAFFSKEPLFNLLAFSSNSILLLVLLLIFLLGMISNFSVLSVFFTNPSKTSKLIISEFHRPQFFLDLVLILMAFLNVLVPIFLINMFKNFNDSSFLIINNITYLNLSLSEIFSYNFLEYYSFYFNLFQILGFLLVPSLIFLNSYNFLGQLNLISDHIILGTINFVGILSSKISKFGFFLFKLNEYIVIEFLFFSASKKTFHSIKKLFINWNFYNSKVFDVNLIFILNLLLYIILVLLLVI